MGLLGVYPAASDHRVNVDDLRVECLTCGEQKMVTVEYYMCIGVGPRCRCGGNDGHFDWLLVFERD
jgi:hypothetical protein